MERPENIDPENSHKYYFELFYEFEEISGLKIRNVFTDSNKWLVLIIL